MKMGNSEAIEKTEEQTLTLNLVRSVPRTLNQTQMQIFFILNETGSKNAREVYHLIANEIIEREMVANTEADFDKLFSGQRTEDFVFQHSRSLVGETTSDWVKEYRNIKNDKELEKFYSKIRGILKLPSYNKIQRDAEKLCEKGILNKETNGKTNYFVSPIFLALWEKQRELYITKLKKETTKNSTAKAIGLLGFTGNDIAFFKIPLD